MCFKVFRKIALTTWITNSVDRDILWTCLKMIYPSFFIFSSTKVDDIDGKIDSILDLLLHQRNQRHPEAQPANTHNPISRSRSDTESAAVPGKKLRPILMNHSSASLSGPTFLNIPDDTGGLLQSTSRQKTVKLQVTRGHSSLGLVNTVEEEVKLQDVEHGIHAAHSAPPFLDHDAARSREENLPPQYADLTIVGHRPPPPTKSHSVGSGNSVGFASPLSVGSPRFITCDEAAFIDDGDSAEHTGADVQFVWLRYGCHVFPSSLGKTSG